MDRAPVITSARFLRLTTASATAKPNALPGVKRSMACIQPGVLAGCPSRGRPMNCLAAMATNSPPNASLSQLTQDAGASLVPAALLCDPSRSRTVTAMARDNVQPMVKAIPVARPLGVASIKMTAIS
jgi:hypothetical protein